MFGTAIPNLVGLALISAFFGEGFWPLTPHDLYSVLSQGILVHVIGQSLIAYAMGHTNANHGAILLLLSPVTAGLAGVYFYGEMLSISKLMGMSLLLLSIILVKSRGNASPKESTGDA